MRKFLISIAFFATSAVGYSQLFTPGSTGSTTGTVGVVTNSTNYVGIGMSNPRSQLQVGLSDWQAPISFLATGWPTIGFNCFYGNLQTTTTTTPTWRRYPGTKNIFASQIQFIPEQGVMKLDVSKSFSGNSNLDAENKLNWNTPEIYFTDGSIGLLTDKIKTGYGVTVGGKIICEGLKISLRNPDGTFPDYVFKPSYKLRSLSEVDSYIAQNHHLPGVPSAQEIGSNDGMDMEQMALIHMEKIEELTLYLIDLEKRLKVLEQENQQLKGLTK